MKELNVPAVTAFIEAQYDLTDDAKTNCALIEAKIDTVTERNIGREDLDYYYVVLARIAMELGATIPDMHKEKMSAALLNVIDESKHDRVKSFFIKMFDVLQQYKGNGHSIKFVTRHTMIRELPNLKRVKKVR